MGFPHLRNVFLTIPSLSFTTESSAFLVCHSNVGMHFLSAYPHQYDESEKKRVAAGAHFPTPWLFEPAKRPDNGADYCFGCSFLYLCEHVIRFYTQV